MSCSVADCIFFSLRCRSGQIWLFVSCWLLGRVCLKQANSTVGLFQVCIPSKLTRCFIRAPSERKKLVGVSFDTKLSMADAIEELVSVVSWKLRALMRTQRFYTHADLLVLYRAPSRTEPLPYITHPWFWKDIGVDEVPRSTVQY